MGTEIARGYGGVWMERTNERVTGGVPRSVTIEEGSAFFGFMENMENTGRVKGVVKLKDGTVHVFYYVRKTKINGKTIYYIDIV